MRESDGPGGATPSLSLTVATLAGWPKYAAVFRTQRAAVENGSTGSVAEWAAYFVGHSRFVPPLGVGKPA